MCGVGTASVGVDIVLPWQQKPLQSVESVTLWFDLSRAC